MTLQELLANYQALPEYCGLDLVDVNQVSLFGDVPMSVAATRGSIEELELLVAAGANLNAKGEHGYSPLHYAVEHGHLHVVEWLLEHGADRSLRNDLGDTAEQLAEILAEDKIMSVLREWPPGIVWNQM